MEIALYWFFTSNGFFLMLLGGVVHSRVVSGLLIAIGFVVLVGVQKINFAEMGE